MALELPFNLNSQNEMDIRKLLVAIGIYFISFCFVGDVWFSTATAFQRVEEISNKILVFFFLLLFSLSLVPFSTHLLIEDTNHETLILYGIIWLIVSLMTDWISCFSLTRYILEHSYNEKITNRFKRRAKNECCWGKASSGFTRIVH
ncbi:MAG: TMEM175 family protein [Streptococcaceae bacterium]|jgi:uncharacterized membrane protein|nr:TMEM175 family protein [Streptococcaceae bacterium]